MKTVYFLLNFLCIFIMGSCAAAGTPTQVYLEQTSLDTITEEYQQHTAGIHDTLPFFLNIAAKEDENFFGYHGSSTKYRLFQDVLRAVFEESLEYDLPEDFYFLRVPGLEDFNTAHNKTAYIAAFGRKMTPDLRETMLQKLVLDSVNNEFGTELKAEELSEDELTLMEGICFDLADFIDPLIDRTTPEKTKFNKMAKERGSSYIQSVKAKSRQIMRFVEENSMLPMASSANIASLINILEKYVGKSESLRSFLHSSLTPKALYEKYYILSYFDEIPYDFYVFLFPFNDTIPDQQERVVCMNVALFGNYFRWDESSIYIFSTDSSIEAGEENVINYLSDFFDEIGLPKGKAKELFETGRDIIRGSEYKMGTLLQFFNISTGERLKDIDESCFVSLDFGKPIININSSDLVKGNYPLKKNDIDLQLRLIMGNDATLNPFGPYRIKRHDMLPKEVSDSIIQSMKEKLKDAPVDRQKKSAYLKKLNQLWSHNFGGDSSKRRPFSLVKKYLPEDPLILEFADSICQSV